MKKKRKGNLKARMSKSGTRSIGLEKTFSSFLGLRKKSSEDKAVHRGNKGASLSSYVKRLSEHLFPFTACKTGLFLCLSGWKCRPTVTVSSKQTKMTDDQVQTEPFICSSEASKTAPRDTLSHMRHCRSSLYIGQRPG